MPAMATCAFIRSGFQWNTGRTLRSRLVCDRLSMVCSTAFSLIRKSEAGDAWNDKIGEIRRARYREGRSIKGISLGLGVSRAGGPEGFAVRRDGVRLRVPDAAASEDRFLAVGAGGDVVGERVPSEARANDADADFRGVAVSRLQRRHQRRSASCVVLEAGVGMTRRRRRRMILRASIRARRTSFDGSREDVVPGGKADRMKVANVRLCQAGCSL